MNHTGHSPRERSLWDLAAPKFCSFPRSVFGIALAGMLLAVGTTAPAIDYDPYLPRIEEVPDKDGSTWKVLIVPRPLYQPGTPPHSALRHGDPNRHLVPLHKPALPPAPSEKSQPKEPYEEPPKKTPAEADDQAAALRHPFKVNFAQDAESPDEEAPAKEEKLHEAETPSKHPFGVEIVPRYSYPILPPSAACCPPEEGAVHVNPADYAWIYESIPYLRSEYIANPSYRHEATMEILFGQLRPTVVHKHPGQPRPHETQFPFENDIIRPYSYYSMGPGAGYGRGPLPFAAPGAYGMNYNFYYPMPTVYRAY